MTAPASLPQPLHTADQPAARASEAPPSPSTAHLPAYAEDFPLRRAEAMRSLAAGLYTSGDGIRGKVHPRNHPAQR